MEGNCLAHPRDRRKVSVAEAQLGGVSGRREVKEAGSERIVWSLVGFQFKRDGKPLARLK